MPSEDGWEPAKASPDQCEWIVVPGTNVHLQLLKGQPLQIMRAYAADYNAFVEPLRDADSAGWTPTNSVATSNHLNGTAMDLNWDSHPFRVSNAGYTPQMIDTMRQILDFYEDTMWWAQDWNEPKDCMHHQMGYDTYGAQNVARVQDFINRKIRSDGFSTFRRENIPVPPSPPPAIDVLVRATGITVDKAIQILPTVQQGLQLSQCINANRIAMWLAQMGHESASFVYTEEIQSGDESTDRWLYKGRTWIQITWRTNYAQFSQWLFDKGLISTPTYFVDHPKELAQQQWAGIGPAWYWTVARPQINSLCDKRDLFDVTQAINGGQNGADDRKRRYDMALALGDQLLALIGTTPPPPPLPQPEGFLMALSDQEQRNLYNAIMNQRHSRSPLRELDEGDVGDAPDQIWDMDGSIHILVVYLMAMLGNPGQLALLNRVASADPGRYPDRQNDRQVAQAILAEVRDSAELRQGILEALGRVTAAAPPPAPQVVYLPAVPEPAHTNGSALAPKDTGEIIGDLYKALDNLRLADALPIEGRAPLAALISVLQTKNGSELGQSQ